MDNKKRKPSAPTTAPTTKRVRKPKEPQQLAIGIAQPQHQQQQQQQPIRQMAPVTAPEQIVPANQTAAVVAHQQVGLHHLPQQQQQQSPVPPPASNHNQQQPPPQFDLLDQWFLNFMGGTEAGNQQQMAPSGQQAIVHTTSGHQPVEPTGKQQQQQQMNVQQPLVTGGQQLLPAPNPNLINFIGAASGQQQQQVQPPQFQSQPAPVVAMPQQQQQQENDEEELQLQQQLAASRQRMNSGLPPFADRVPALLPSGVTNEDYILLAWRERQIMGVVVGFVLSVRRSITTRQQLDRTDVRLAIGPDNSSNTLCIYAYTEAAELEMVPTGRIVRFNRLQVKCEVGDAERWAGSYPISLCFSTRSTWTLLGGGGGGGGAQQQSPARRQQPHLNALQPAVAAATTQGQQPEIVHEPLSPTLSNTAQDGDDNGEEEEEEQQAEVQLIAELPPRRRQSAINAGAVISEIAVEEARRVDRQYGSSRRRRRPEVRPTTSSGQCHAHPRQFYTFAHDDIDADEEEEGEDNAEQVEEDDLGPDDEEGDEAFRRAVNLFPRRTNLNNNSTAEEFRGPIVREQQGGGLHPIAAGPLGATPAIRAAAQQQHHPRQRTDHSAPTDGGPHKQQQKQQANRPLIRPAGVARRAASPESEMRVGGAVARRAASPESEEEDGETPAQRLNRLARAGHTPPGGPIAPRNPRRVRRARTRTPPPPAPPPPTAVPASAEVVREILDASYVLPDAYSPGRDANGEELEICCVCQEGFLPRQLVSSGPCMHKLHKECMDGVVKTMNACPHCRHPF